MAVARRRPALPAGLWLVALAAVGAARAEEPAATAGARDCAPVSQWREPGAGGPRPLATAEVFARAATARVVLLGETHDSAEHHRWQLQVLAGLHAGRPQLVLALEMFPRRSPGGGRASPRGGPPSPRPTGGGCGASIPRCTCRCSISRA